MKPIHSLRTKILIIVLAFIAVKGAAFLVYTIVTTVNYKRLRLEGIEETVKFETEKVNRIISELERGSVFYALGGTLYHDAQSEELSEKFAIEFLAGFSSPVGGGIWFEPYAYKKDKLRAGFYAFRDKASGTIRLDDIFLTDEYDYHNKSWYREIMDGSVRPYQVVWTRPYIDDSGSFSLMTTAGSPVYDANGKIIAISTVDWEIEEVIKELLGVKPTQNSFVLLCVPENDYIISSTYTNSATGASVKSIPWDIASDSFLLDGVKYFQFGRYMGNGWLMSVQIPENEIIAEVEKQNVRFSVFISISAVFMLSLAFFLVSKFINGPIKQLTTEVSQLAIDNLDTRIKISSNDELGQLAEVYNKMKSDLKKSIEENVRERAEIERINAELNVATDIQASMLPNVFPPFPDRNEFDLCASMIPARHVGGDFYDFYFINKDNLAVVIADVLGKGVPAALFMVVTKTLIENCSFCKSPKAVFESVNKKLLKNNEAEMFVTAFMGFYNIPTGKFVYVNAGHNPPLLKKQGEDFKFLKTDPCFVLAWKENAKYIENEITLDDGDVLYLYTDGVTEAMNPHLELFSEERLVAALNNNKDATCRELLHAVKNEVDNFCGGAEQADDITMLALKIGGPQETESRHGQESSVDNAEDDKMKELRLEAKSENLDTVMDFVNGELEKCGYPVELQNEIDMAVEEIFINIANYAYSPESGEAAVFISTTDKTILKFEDTGRPYNPLLHSGPDLEKPLSEREIGGLGIFLVKKIMDTVEYCRVDNKNILIMTKNHPFKACDREESA